MENPNEFFFSQFFHLSITTNLSQIFGETSQKQEDKQNGKLKLSIKSCDW